MCLLKYRDKVSSHYCLCIVMEILELEDDVVAIVKRLTWNLTKNVSLGGNVSIVRNCSAWNATSGVTSGKPPFTYVGVDWFGPSYVTQTMSRQRETMLRLYFHLLV